MAEFMNKSMDRFGHSVMPRCDPLHAMQPALESGVLEQLPRLAEPEAVQMNQPALAKAEAAITGLVVKFYALKTGDRIAAIEIAKKLAQIGIARIEPTQCKSEVLTKMEVDGH